MKRPGPKKAFAWLGCERTAGTASLTVSVRNALGVVAGWRMEKKISITNRRERWNNLSKACQE